jgi:NAD(P)H-flavin reductase
MRFALLALERRDVPPARIYLSLERNMQCGAGWCGHCQLGGVFVCKDGPVLRHDAVRGLLTQRGV